MKKLLKNLILIIFTAVTLAGCGVTKPRYIDIEREVITYKDSTILNVRDSIVMIPIERIVDIVPTYDTLVLESSVASSKAWVDTSYHLLRGELQNKPEIAKEWHIQYVDRIIERTDTLVRTETKEVPVEVVKYKTPGWSWFLLALFLSIVGWKIYRLIR